MKRRRVEAMKEKITAQGNSIKEKFLAEYEFQYGVSRRKALEYLDLLTRLNFISIIKKDDFEVIQLNGIRPVAEDNP